MTQARYYQQEAVGSIFKELKTLRSTGLFLATGLGKTFIAGDVARQWPGRVLFLCDRDELIGQSAKALSSICQVPVEIEQGKRESRHARVVVGSVQSLAKQHRLDRLGHDAFSLVIVDEADVFVTKTRLKVINWFTDAKILSMTATPDRHDGKGLKPIAESTAYEMDITRGIKEGFLAPIVIGRVHIDSIDVSGLKKVSGDLHQAGLEKVMLENVGAVVDKALELHPNRKAIFFFPGIESAELAAQRINSLDPDTAVFISGKTPEDERREKIEGFRSGKYTRLCNCEIATRGFDVPDVSLVVLARPTLSRAKHSQMVGRGTRTAGGCIDGLLGRGDEAERHAAIEWSGKPTAIVLDFVGNTGKHELATVVDLMGAGFTEEERKVARKSLDDLGVDEVADPAELLRNARTKLEARKRALAGLQFRVSARVEYLSPFDALSLDMNEVRETELKMGRMPLSPGRQRSLERFGVDPADVASMSKLQGDKMYKSLLMRDKFGYANYDQTKLLAKWGITKRIKRKQAKAACNYIHDCGHGTTSPVDMGHLEALATGAP